MSPERTQMEVAEGQTARIPISVVSKDLLKFI